MHLPSYTKAGTIYYKHLIDITTTVNGKPFNTRVTLSYGFYDKTPIKTGYITPIPKDLFMFPRGWYFGVNLRIKCEQAGNIHTGQVQRADNFYKKFNQPYVFPKYINNNNDQGVDFFACPNITPELLEKLKRDFNAEDIEIAKDSEAKIDTENYEDWLKKTLDEFEDLFNQIK